MHAGNALLRLFVHIPQGYFTAMGQSPDCPDCPSAGEEIWTYKP